MKTILFILLAFTILSNANAFKKVRSDRVMVGGYSETNIHDKQIEKVDAFIRNNFSNGCKLNSSV